MSKNLIISLAAVTLLYFGCSKSNNSDNGPKNTTPAPVKIEIVSGSGQTDTVGRQLVNPVVIKVTQNGVALAGYTVQFQGSGCNSDNIFSNITPSDGNSSYIWRLAGDIGQQTLKVYVLNSQNQKVDSVTATSTGIAAASGWHYAACTLQGGNLVSAFCKLSTGRLFACYTGRSYLRYSDDNGASWNAVTSLGDGHNLLYAVSSPSDEIYVFAENEGTLYSSDGGQTWISLSIAPFNNGQIQSGIATADGKLIVTSPSNVIVSIDKGKTWTNTPSSSFVAPNTSGGDTNFVCGGEDQAGALYVVGREDETIFKSTDNGSTWAAIPKNNEFDFGLFIDNSDNWFYKSRSDSNGGGIYLSMDNGNTYSQLINASNTFLDQLSVQSDGNYYYENIATGLYQSSGLSGSAKLIFGFTSPQGAPYIVAKNNNIAVWKNNSDQIFYYQK